MDDRNISGPINAPTPQPPAADQLTEIEKQMTGFERATLRWTKAAVFMSFLAAGFVRLQWIEMRNGATDIDRTQLRHAVQAAFLLPHTPHPLVHHTARFPGHAALVHAPAIAVSGMRPVQSVSHLPGLNHNLAQRGRGGKHRWEYPERRRRDSSLTRTHG